MNTSSLIDLISLNKQYETHRKKIGNIMTKSSHSISFRKNDYISNYYSSKSKAKNYSQRSKQMIVQKQNDIILKKIINVNKRSSNYSHKPEAAHHRLSNLRKQIIKTNQQNMKLATKLVSTSSKLNQNVIGSDLKKYNQIKQRLRKYTTDQTTGQIIPKKVKSLSKLVKLQPLFDTFSSRVQNQQRQ